MTLNLDHILNRACASKHMINDTDGHGHVTLLKLLTLSILLEVRW